MMPLKSDGAEKGCLFLLVGNSGSGKDALIDEVRRGWPPGISPLLVPRRYITRPAHLSEPYHAVTPNRFDDMDRRGCFCLTWHSYGLNYGLPVKIQTCLARGWPVLANVSRQTIDRARREFSRLKVVFVHVPLAVTLERMHRRGREDCLDDVFKQRRLRAEQNQLLEGVDLTLDNSGPIHVAAGRLRDFILLHVARGKASRWP
jgi:ribose 1,5-bisphosphokinase